MSSSIMPCGPPAHTLPQSQCCRFRSAFSPQSSSFYLEMQVFLECIPSCPLDPGTSINYIDSDMRRERRHPHLTGDIHTWPCHQLFLHTLHQVSTLDKCPPGHLWKAGYWWSRRAWESALCALGGAYGPYGICYTCGTCSNYGGRGSCDGHCALPQVIHMVCCAWSQWHVVYMTGMVHV